MSPLPKLLPSPKPRLLLVPIAVLVWVPVPPLVPIVAPAPAAAEVLPELLEAAELLVRAATPTWEATATRESFDAFLLMIESMLALWVIEVIASLKLRRFALLHADDVELEDELC